MLVCVECGCCDDELGKGWAAYRWDDPAPGELGVGRPGIAFSCPDCAVDLGHRARLREPARAFSVTMVRPGVVPSFEVGAFEYVGRGLPLVGETIVLRRTEGPDAGEVVQGYVTRVSPGSEPPIAVTESGDPTAPDRPRNPA